METMWHYVKNGTDNFGPVSESELLSLASSGQISPTDLVWSEGMPDWLAMNCVPALTGHPAAAPLQTAGSVLPGVGPAQSRPSAAFRPASRAAEIPAGLGGWMKFVGIMNIIGGSITCFFGVVSIITIIGPIIYVPTGVLLILAGTALTAGKSALLNADSFDPHIALFLEKLKRFMVIQGVFYIFSLICVVSR